MAVLLMALVGADAAASSQLCAKGVWILAFAAVALMSVSLVVPSRRSVQWAIGILGATYVVSLVAQGVGVDPWSPLVAAALLAAAELAHWSIDCRLRAIDERQVHIQRGLAIGAVTGVALGLGAIVLAGSGVALVAGNVTTAAASGAVGFAFAAIAIIAWQRRNGNAEPSAQV
jgi:hypothetical protein